MQLINPHSQIDSTLTLTLDNEREEEDEAYKVLHVHQVAPHAVVGALIPIIPRRHPGRRRGTEVVGDMASSAKGNRVRRERVRVSEREGDRVRAGSVFTWSGRPVRPNGRHPRAVSTVADKTLTGGPHMS